MTVWIRCRCELAFNLETPTPFVFMLRPQSGPHQWITTQKFNLTPAVPALEYIDNFGNRCQRVVAPAGRFELHSMTVAQTSAADDEQPSAGFVEVQNLPTDLMGYLYPSRYCESDRLGKFAAEITSNYQPGYSQVAAIATWIRNHIDYRPGSSNEPVTALDVKQRGYGVCRDLAHLGMALCRGLCIPSRMVVGYLFGLQPMDMHAWFEAYVGDRWYTVDPTQTNLTGSRLAVAYGRDAADVATFTQFGDLVVPTREFVSVEQFAEKPE